MGIGKSSLAGMRRTLLRISAVRVLAGLIAGLDPPAGLKPLRRDEGPAIHHFQKDGCADQVSA
jgi:hypothetical protein